jgi:hypothetical protein
MKTAEEPLGKLFLVGYSIDVAHGFIPNNISD